MLRRSADSCQIIQQCLSPVFGKRRLIHPCQLHGAAVWDPSGGGLELEAFMWKCYFRSMYLVEHQWHFDALFHLKPSHIGCEAARRGRMRFQRTNNRKRRETLLQTRHSAFLVSPVCSQGLKIVPLEGHGRRRGRFSALEVSLVGQIYTHCNYRGDKLGTEYIVWHLAYLHGCMSSLNPFPIQKRKHRL